MTNVSDKPISGIGRWPFELPLMGPPGGADGAVLSSLEVF